MQPREAIETKLLTEDSGGHVYAREMKSGAKDQTYFDEKTGEILNDDGTPVEEKKTTYQILMIKRNYLNKGGIDYVKRSI